MVIDQPKGLGQELFFPPAMVVTKGFGVHRGDHVNVRSITPERSQVREEALRANPPKRDLITQDVVAKEDPEVVIVHVDPRHAVELPVGPDLPRH